MQIGIGMSLTNVAGKGSAATGPTILWMDSFGRADNAATLGAPDIGSTWTASSGTSGILAGEAYFPSDNSGNRAVTKALSTADYTVICRVKGQIAALTPLRQPCVVVRYNGGTDTDWLHVALENGNVILRKLDVSVSSDLASAAQATVNDTWYTIKVVCLGVNITVFVDGVQKIAYTLAGADATKYLSFKQAGFRITKAGAPTIAARFDDFVVTTP